MSWAQIYKSVANCGLDIQFISVINMAMLGKWLWWGTILKSCGVDWLYKYKIANSGWLVPNADCRAFDLWKSILFVQPEFEGRICFQVHKEQQVSFGMTMVWQLGIETSISRSLSVGQEAVGCCSRAISIGGKPDKFFIFFY